MEGIQPTLPIGGYGDGFNSGFWIIALVALMNGGFGGYGRNNVATADDLNFGRLENQVRMNENYIQQGFTNMGNGICNLGYTLAEKFGETNALVIAENQKTRDLIQQNKIESLQSKVSQLELNQALAGVVRYPNGFTYNAGSSPFCNCGGCNF